MTHTLGELAERVGGRVIGDPDCAITGVGTLGGARAGDISFLTNRRYRKQLAFTGASAVIVAEGDEAYCPGNALVVANPHVAYALIAGLFAPGHGEAAGIHETATVDPSAHPHDTVVICANAVVGPGAVLEQDVYIGPGSVVGRDSRIGAGSRLAANVTVYHGVEIGKRALIHAGAVIGSDGFGFANDGGEWVKVPQLGGVRIGDDVEIGACTTVDRGAIEDTVIEDGVKLDNQVQVAHNVHIGAHTAIAGCVGIAGSTTIGRQCAIGGGAGILGHLEIAERVTVTAMSLVTKSIAQPGIYSSGTPLEPNEQWHRNFVRFKQLDDMARRLKALEKELQTLKERMVP